MHNVLTGVLPRQSVDTVFVEVFRHLMKSFDDLYSVIIVQTKYGKKRIQVDLNFFNKNLLLMKLENEELIGMVKQKVDTIITAKCELKEEES